MIENLISNVRLAVIFACLSAAGCAGIDLVPPVASRPVEPPALMPSLPSASVTADAPAPVTAPVPPQPESKLETKAAPSPAPAVAAPTPKPAAAKEAAVDAEPAPKAAAPAKAEPKTDSKTADAKPAAAEPAKSQPPAPVARKQEPTLDVAGLKARLGETKAIGVFTKLALKNQMDDLLDRFRALYQSGQKTGVASLRPPFDALVLKVVAQLRPGDPSLARTIESSREAIWGILSDPEKFKSVT